MTLRNLDRTQKFAALDVLCAGFYDYPVPRYVIDAPASDYDGSLRELIDFFVEGRLTRGVPLIGLYDSSDLLGVAVVSPPRRNSSFARLGLNGGLDGRRWSDSSSTRGRAKRLTQGTSHTILA